MLSGVLAYRNQFIVILSPLLFLPLPLLATDKLKEAQCGYVMLLMAVFWSTEALPLGVTSLLPIFLLPFLGIIGIMEAAGAFVGGPTMLFIGVFILALAIEKCNLHRRLALNVLLLLGSQPASLMFGFMIISWCVSMWMCNTATVAMLLPILESVIQQLKKHGKVQLAADSAEMGRMYADNKVRDISVPLEITSANCGSPRNAEYKTNAADEVCDQNVQIDIVEDSHADDNDKAVDQLAKGLTLIVCFAANIGGVSTINGAIPNMIMQGVANQMWTSHKLPSSPVHFSSWMVFGFPVALINLVFLWIWMSFLFLGYRSVFGVFCCNRASAQMKAAVKKILLAERAKLGKFKFAELIVTILFMFLVCLWVFREPGFKGWGDYFPKGYIRDANPAVVIAVALFIIPSQLPRCGKSDNVLTNDRYAPVRTLMDWKTVQQRLPWGIIFIMGGGFVLAKAATKSGLSKWLGMELAALKWMPMWVMVLVICLMVALLTEFISNPAACSLLMPIVGPLAVELGMNPLYLMFPVCLATSFAFMLPAAAPPNAIVFSYGRLRTIDMMKAGFVMNLVCVATVVLATHTWGMAYFDFNVAPWKPSNMTSDMGETAMAMGGM